MWGPLSNILYFILWQEELLGPLSNILYFILWQEELWGPHSNILYFILWQEELLGPLSNIFVFNSKTGRGRRKWSHLLPSADKSINFYQILLMVPRTVLPCSSTVVIMKLKYYLKVLLWGVIQPSREVLRQLWRHLPSSCTLYFLN